MVYNDSQVIAIPYSLTYNIIMAFGQFEVLYTNFEARKRLVFVAENKMQTVITLGITKPQNPKTP